MHGSDSSLRDGRTGAGTGAGICSPELEPKSVFCGVCLRLTGRIAFTAADAKVIVPLGSHSVIKHMRKSMCTRNYWWHMF